MSNNTESAYLGGGCFWCLEAVYQRVRGVVKVTSGYAGGSTGQVSFDQLHKQDTGHAEVVKIDFDPSIISYEKLLEIFWHVHDPTTRDRQGNDVGSMYRSIILTADADQAHQAEKSMDEVASKLWEDPIVTESVPLDDFYPAEEDHQNYYNNNPGRMYCSIVIDPKLSILRKQFSPLLNEVAENDKK